MNKKHFLLLFTFVCLCVTNAWGVESWFNDVEPQDGASFYLCSKKTGLQYFAAANKSSLVLANEATMWTWSTSNYYALSSTIDENTYYMKFANNSASLSNTTPPTSSATNDADINFTWSESGSYYMVRLNHRSGTNSKYRYWFVNSSGNSYNGARNENDANDNSQWYLISSKQYANHMAVLDYETASASIASYNASNLPNSVWNNVSSNVGFSETFNEYLTANESNHSAEITEKTNAINGWLSTYSDVADMANAYPYVKDIINNATSVSTELKEKYASSLETKESASDIWGVLDDFRTEAIDSIVLYTPKGQIADVTFMIDNPDFECSFDWDYGWKGTTDANKGPGADPEFFEKYTNSGNTCARVARDYYFFSHEINGGNLYQSFALPEGSYLLSALTISKTRSSNFYVKNSSGEEIAGQTLSNSDYLMQSLSFTIDAQQSITIGASHTKTRAQNELIIAYDDFKLTYFAAQSVADGSYANTAGNWSWADSSTGSSDGEGWYNKQYKLYANVPMVECYNNDNDKTEDIMSCTISGLSNNGFYTAIVGFNAHSTMTAVSGTVGKRNLAVLNVGNQRTSAPLVEGGDAAITTCNFETVPFIYVSDNTLTLTVSAKATGVNWISTMVQALAYLGSTYDLTVSSAKWASLCLPYAAVIPSGITAYYAKATSASEITLSPITTTNIAANEPIIVNATSAGRYTFAVAEEDIPEKMDDDVNFLRGVTKYTDFNSGEKYVLGGVDNNEPFFSQLIAQSDINAPKAYLPAYKVYVALPEGESSSPARLNLVIEEENNTTGVNTINTDVQVKKVYHEGQIHIIRGNELYDLMGRRIK